MENYAYDNGGDTRIFEKNPNDIDKCIICSCAKNEDEYIAEWVQHHLSIGFDKILIADNNDEFGKLNSILKNYIDSGTVQIFDFSGLKSIQLPFYSMIVNSKNYEWVALFDIDEFLEISPKYDNIKSLLNEITEDCLLVNWLMYGPNGHTIKTEGRVQDRFPLPILPITMTKENFFFKPIISKRSPLCAFSSSHEPIFTTQGNYSLGGYKMTSRVFQTSYPPRYKKVWLKHYYTKSFEEYMEKVKRGWPDWNDNNALRDISHYFLLNASTEVDLAKFDRNIFDEKNNTFITEIIKDYDVIYIRNRTDKSAYFSLLYDLGNAMSRTRDYTYCVSENIDENIFNMLFEIALRTGNRLVATKEDNCWDLFEKYGKKGGTYYIIF